MEVPGAKNNKVAIFFFEAVGSAFLVAAYNWTSASGPVLHVLGVAFTYFALYSMFGQISGAHFNPAVTLAVMISKKLELYNVFIALGMIVFQLIGGGIGGFIARMGYTIRLDDPSKAAIHP